ncbi:MAG: M48 family metalloprotease [Caldisericia bacterium]|nr:M48 family metalloprotease [Caldisericia bacterium]
MTVEMILAIYFSLLFPVMWFVMTPYLKNYRVMITVGILSVVGFVAGSWLLADLIPKSLKLTLTPIATTGVYYNATLTVAKDIWSIIILCIPWVIISIVIVRLVLGFILLSKKTRGFKPADGRLQLLLDKLAFKYGVNSPKLFVGSANRMAFSTLGSIYISKSIVDSLSYDKLSALLAHELAHIGRHDQISRWCYMIISSLSLLAPPTAIKKRYDLMVEIETDRKATEILGDPIPLAQTLLFCARRLTPQLSATNLTSTESLTIRVKSLLSEDIPTRNTNKAGKPILVFALILFLNLLMVVPSLTAITNVEPPMITGLSEVEVVQLLDGEMVARLVRNPLNQEQVKMKLIPKDVVEESTQPNMKHVVHCRRKHCRTTQF